MNDDKRHLDRHGVYLDRQSRFSSDMGFTPEGNLSRAYEAFVDGVFELRPEKFLECYKILTGRN